MTINYVICVDVPEELNLGEIFLVGVPLREYAADKLALYMCILSSFLNMGDQTRIITKSLICLCNKCGEFAKTGVYFCFRRVYHIG